jgi:hypothetical protein
LEAELLKTVGQIAGIGGLALGVFLLLFRDIIRKQIFPQLAKKDAYRLLQLVAIRVFLIAALGIAAWVWTGTAGSIIVGDDIDASCSSVNTGTVTNAQISVECADAQPAR